MGSIDEEEMKRYIARFPVHNKWQRTYINFAVMCGYGLDDIMMRHVAGFFSEQKRLKNIEEECNRFWRHNKAFLRKEYESIKNMDTKKIQAYLCRLMKKRHYLLGFTLSVKLIRKNYDDEYIPDAITITMLNALRHY